MLGQLVEVGRVHRQALDRLELGRDLLQPEPGSQGDVDIRVHGWVEERGHELVRRHRPAEDEVAGLELVGQALLDRDQDERPAVGEEALLLQPLGDSCGGLARPDLERDLLAVGRRGSRQLVPEIRADRVGHEIDAERSRVVGRPAHDR